MAVVVLPSLCWFGAENLALLVIVCCSLHTQNASLAITVTCKELLKNAHGKGGGWGEGTALHPCALTPARMQRIGKQTGEQGVVPGKLCEHAGDEDCGGHAGAAGAALREARHPRLVSLI